MPLTTRKRTKMFCANHNPHDTRGPPAPATNAREERDLHTQAEMGAIITHQCHEHSNADEREPENRSEHELCALNVLEGKVAKQRLNERVRRVRHVPEPVQLRTERQHVGRSKPVCAGLRRKPR